MRNFDKDRFLKRPLLATAIAMAIATPAAADDLDVFNAALSAQTKPNLVFVLDYSVSMDRTVDGKKIAASDTTTQSKIDILRDAMDEVLEANAGKVNVGIASLFNGQASGVRWPVTDLEIDAHEVDPAIPAGQFTAADVISRELRSTGTELVTSSVNALAEAAAYFRGDPVSHYGADPDRVLLHKPDVWDPISQTYDGGNPFAAMPSSYQPSNAFKFDVDGDGYDYCTNVNGGTNGCDGKITLTCETVAASGSDPGYETCTYRELGEWTTPNYKSPIAQQCQANYMIFISDGNPTHIEETPTLTTVLNAAGVASIDDCASLSPSIFPASHRRKDMGNCGPEILDYLAKTDINPDIPGSNVQTYTVGFALKGPGALYLDHLSQMGRGKFFDAQKPEDLSDALASILNDITAGSQNFSELSIDVNTDTFSHDNKTFFSLFTPRPQSSWEGNLKGYFLDETGLLDIHGAPATFDDGTGLKFSETAQSFWSDSIDGNEVGLGGASESITSMPPAPNTRNMYTYIDGNSKQLATDDDNLLVNVGEDLMGNPGEAARDSALAWLSNAPMGDPLHTKPVVVNYAGKRVIYVMTNQGFLHAFDASQPLTANSDTTGGDEIFAFMPQELLPNIPALANASTTTGDHIYGLDGGLIKWHNDENNNGVVDDRDSLMLVFGMRRGGNNYYALDVTDPDNPVFKWQINENKPKFEDIAQTWSRPSLINVNHGGAEKRVIMFGGGYDADTLDDQPKNLAATGNAVYMADENGAHVWDIGSMEHPKMKYSIASDLTVLDSDNNGVADRAYFGDMGGQMWRVDFDDVASMADTQVTLFADVSDGADDHQPIFYKPSVSLNRENGELFMAVAFGTGDRTDPLNTSSQNAFYMLRDKNYKVGPPVEHDDSTIIPLKIANLTENLIGSTDDNIRAAAEQELAAKRGWKVDLNRSEKSLSAVTTFEGKLIATTFEPEAITDPCSFSTLGRLYIMDILDATPIQILPDGTEITEGLDKTHRITMLNSTTIPSSPVIVYPPNSDKVQLLVDKESIVTVNRQLRTVYWHAR